MEPTTSLISSSFHHPTSFPAGFRQRPAGLTPLRKTRLVRFAHKRDTYGWDFGGARVDDSMIVLRRRIREMKMAERIYEPPSDWMEWEKRYYASYESNVCAVVGIVQALLMNARPSLAIGMVALVTLSVPASVVLILLRFMEASTSILPGV